MEADEFTRHLELETLEGIKVEYVNYAWKIDDIVKY